MNTTNTITMRCFIPLLLLSLACSPSLLRAQDAQLAEKKTYTAARTVGKIKIDGQLTDDTWQAARVEGGFLRSWPTPGTPPTYNTTFQLAYDDHAIYVAIRCYAPHPDSIFRRVTKRDELENTDDVSIVFDTYRDGQNAVLFGVSPENVQFDTKFSIANANPNNGDADGADNSWDAVWSSATAIVQDGWVAEIEIPYSAIRFPKKQVQEWGINVYRGVTKTGENYSWNEIKANINGSLNQMGILQGIKGIKAPLRLSATPFVAGYANNLYQQPGSSWSTPYSIGMDVKYGLNEAFTLDATLIPDFGQVRSDQNILNLSPFEVRFNENRPFFTEGTELFNKGGLFYSRRVGGRPIHYWDAYDQVGSNEELVDNQANALLINATKISGRTNKGLGIGVFNALEAPAHATVKNQTTEETREIQTSPLTNKNIFVFDQNLRNNSSIAFINTNVTRFGNTRDANVSGIIYNLKTKKQDYGVSGQATMSNRYNGSLIDRGYSSNLDFSKTSGNFQFGGSYGIETDKYNPNDLGYLQSPNDNGGYVWANYNRYKPWWKLNNFWTSMWTGQERLFSPNVWVNNSIGYNFGLNTRNFHNIGFNSNMSLQGRNDYFEAATSDFSSYLHIPRSFRVGGWYNSDYRKKLVANAFYSYRKVMEQGRYAYSLYGGLRWRASDKLTIGTNAGYERSHRNLGNMAFSTGINPESVGYSTLSGEQLQDGIFLGYRGIKGWNNDLEISYSFNNRMNLWLFVRHYWNQVHYDEFGTLNQEGGFSPIAYTGKSEDGRPLNDESVNFFNIDLVYTWRFAPGSDLLVTYKNAVSNYVSGFDARFGYGQNVEQLRHYPGQNTLSVKVLYFIDYERLTRRK
jgi:hypothetical protein